MEEEWTELFSEKHQRKYWKNKTTGQTSWKNPMIESTSLSSAPPVQESKKEADTSASTTTAQDEWQELFNDKHQRKYWKNKKTGQSSWKPPASSNDITNQDPTREKDSVTTAKVSSNTAGTPATVSDEWEEHFSQKHNRKYWKSKSTGKTSWSNPDAAASSSGEVTAKDGDQSVTSVQQPIASSDESEWVESFSEKHNRKYWKNKTTGKTTWTKPPELEVKSKPAESSVAAAVAEAPQAAVVSDEWEEKYSDKHGRKYWKHKATGKTSWTAPAADSLAALSRPTSGHATPVSVPAQVEDEWEELFSEKHKRKYWKNKTSGKTSWTKPEMKTSIPTPVTPVPIIPVPVVGDKAVISSDWVESFSEKHKRKFWKNKVTGKTSWTDPSGAVTPRSAAPSAPASAAPSAAPSATPSAAPSTAASPLTVSSDVAKVADNRLTFRSLCFIEDSNSEKKLVNGSHFIEVLVGDQSTVTRTMQIQHQPVVTDTAESVLPSMENFPEKGCTIVDEWNSVIGEVGNSSAFAPRASLSLKKQIDSEQGIVSKTDVLLPGLAILPKLVKSQLRLPVADQSMRISYLEKYGNFTEAYETARILGDLVDLEAAFAVGDSSSYKIVVPESSISAELEKKENSVLFHLTDYKKIQLQNESLMQQQLDHPSKRFPTSGILSLKIVQLSSSLSPFSGSKSTSCFAAKSDIRWIPCWVEVDLAKQCIHFHEQGPNQSPTFTLSCEMANIQFSDRHSKSLELDISSCAILSTAAGTVSNANTLYGVKFNFASQEELTAWYYSFVLAIFGNSQSSPRLPYQVPTSVNPHSWKVNKSEDERPSLSSKLIQYESCIVDQELACLHLRVVRVSSLQLKSMKLQFAAGRAVVQAQGKCVKIPAGSVLVSMNGVSAVDLPGHTVTRFISDLPKQMIIDVTFLKPVSAQYSAEMMLAVAPRSNSSIFASKEDSPFSPTKTSSKKLETQKMVDPIAEKVANQVNFEEAGDWQPCQVLLQRDTLTVNCKSSEAYRFPLSSLSLILVNPSTISNGMNFVTSVTMEIACEVRRIRIRIPMRAQFHCLLRSIIASLKLYGGIAWDVDLIRSLNDAVSEQLLQKSSNSIQAHDEFQTRNITSVSVLLSQSQFEASTQPSSDVQVENEENQGLQIQDLYVSQTIRSGRSIPLADNGGVDHPALSYSLPVPNLPELNYDSVIDAAEALQTLLQDLNLPSQFPTAGMVEKMRQELRGHARRNVQLMANVLSSQVEACYPTSIFSKMSVALRESEMQDEVKENDEDLDVTNSNANLTFDETITGSLIDGEETNNATVGAPIMRRRASFNLNTASASGGNIGSNSNSMDAMQQRQFNKAARRASRLSINMDLATTQMFSMGAQTASTSSSSSSLSRTMLKNAIKLTADERTAISTLFQYFREHPSDLLALSTKLSTFQDMLSFSFIIVHRLYSPLSTDQNSIEGLLKESFQFRNDKGMSINTGVQLTQPLHLERVPFFSNESRVLQSFDEFSQNLHQKLLFSHQKYAQNHNQYSSSSAVLSNMSICLLYELYCRPEIIAFLESLVPRLSTEALSVDSGVADICSKIVEPICARLHLATEQNSVPFLLKIILHAIQCHSNNLIHSEDFLSIILTPYVCNSLIDNQIQRGLGMDSASQHIVNRVHDLLFACFDQSLGRKLQLSLSDSAALSRSRWFIARAMDSLVQEVRPSSSNGIANFTLSPVARLAGMRAETNRPKDLESFICLKPSELLYMLKMFDLSSIATSLLVTTSRAVSESMSILSASDLMNKLSSYVILNPASSNNASASAATPGLSGGGNNTSSAIATIGRRTYLPTVLDRDVVYIFDMDESGKEKDAIIDLLNDEDLLGNSPDRMRTLIDSASGNKPTIGASNSSMFASDEESVAVNELQVINWLLAAARTSLTNIFENALKVHSVQTVRELRELRDKLTAKVSMIRAILSDWQALQMSQDVLRLHQSQLSLIDDLYKTRKLKSDFFKGPTTMMGPPVAGNSEQSLLSSGRLPVLIAATRMIYVDYIEVRPLTLTVAMDEEKEHLLLQVFRQQLQADTRVLLQRLSEALQPTNTASFIASSGMYPMSPSQRKVSQLNVEDILISTRSPGSNLSRSARNMNPLWVIMQNVFVASSQQEGTH